MKSVIGFICVKVDKKYQRNQKWIIMTCEKK